VTVSGNVTIGLGLNHDGVIDSSISIAGRVVVCAGTGKGAFGEVNVAPTQSGGVVSAWPGSGWAAALAKGVEIDASQNFYTGQALITEFSTCLWPIHGPAQGEWEEPATRYLGLVFQINGLTHSGWARLTVHLGNTGPVTTLTGFRV
jgi:hypothetical protein